MDFDIDVGPKINGVYPSIDLAPSEASNMLVHIMYYSVHSSNTVFSQEHSHPSRTPRSSSRALKHFHFEYVDYMSTQMTLVSLHKVTDSCMDLPILRNEKMQHRGEVISR